MSSLATLIKDTYKPWLDVRVNDITIDGNISTSTLSVPTFLEGIFPPNTVATTLYLTKIGQTVTLNMNMVLGTQNGTSAYMSTHDLIPMGYRPVVEQRPVMGLISGGSQILGACAITPAGNVVFNVCEVSGVNIRDDRPFPASTGQSGIEGFSASWIIT